jgi:formate dehydrogenase subunit gamma
MSERTRRVIPLKPEPPSSLTGAEQQQISAICQRLKDEPGPLIVVLHAVQRAVGYVPPDAVPLIARELNVSMAEVHGVISFYHYFRKTRPGRQVVHVCRAEACQAVGAVELEAHAKRTLGIDYHGTSADGAVSLEPVYCLGNCALGPSVMIDEELHGRVTPQRLDALLAQSRR